MLKVILLAILFPISAFGQGFTFRDPAFKCATPASGGGAGTVAITSQSDIAGNIGARSWMGVKFSCVNNVTVTDLGRWVIPGNSEVHHLAIYLWTGNGSLGTALVDITVNLSGATSGAFLYASTGGVSLSAGSTYAFVSSESGSDAYVNEGSVVMTADFTVIDDIFSTSGSTWAELNGPGAFSDSKINFKYTNP